MYVEDKPTSRVKDKDGLTEGRARFAYLYVLGPGGIAGRAKLAYAIAFKWIERPEDFDDLPTYRQIRAQEFGNMLADKPPVKKAIERHRRALEIETGQSRATWIARAVEMRDECMRRGKEQAAAKIHRDIGEALEHFKTRIEINSVPRSGDIITEIAQLLKDNPGLMMLTMQQLRAVDLQKMLESHPEIVAESEPPPKTHEQRVSEWNPGACP